MPRTYLHRYAVEGTGRFPIDMLRYDGSWPATEHRAPKDWLPTDARWRSFGWIVLPASHTTTP